MAWNRPSEAPKVAPKKKPSAWRGAVAGIVTVAVAATVAFFMLPGGDANLMSKAEKNPSSIKSVNPASTKSASVGKGRKDRVQRIKSEFNERVKEYVKAPLTNKEEWVKSSYDPNDPDNAFRTRLAQDISLLIAIVPGEPMPPLPFMFMDEDREIRVAEANGEKVITTDGGNKRFLDELKKWRVTIKATDKDSTVEYKKQFAEAQLELLNAMEEGVSVNDSIRAAYEFRKKAYEMRTDAIKMLREFHAEDSDVELAKKLVEEVNAKFKEEGIRQVPIEEVVPDYVDPKEMEGVE